MTKPIETQPGSPTFDGAEAYELYQSDVNRAYAMNKGTPSDSRPVLAVVRKSHTDYKGKTTERRVIVRAQYIRHKEMESAGWEENDGVDWYCDEDDRYYIQEGWYELMEFWEEYGFVLIDEPVIGWFELPKLPEET